MGEWTMCRLCLESSEEPLKAMTESTFQASSYFSIYFSVVGINLTDYSTFPMKICPQCENDMLRAFEFRRKCLDTEEKLKDLKGAEEESGSKTIEFVAALDELTTAKSAEAHLYPAREKRMRFSGQETAQQVDEHEVVSGVQEEKDVNLKIRCKICKGFFNEMETFRTHLCGKSKTYIDQNADSEEQSEAFFKCNKCGKTFIGRSYFMAHLDQHTERKIRHRCNYCNMEFNSTVTRTTHIHREHLKTPSCHCPYCGKGFYDKNRRTNHIRDKHTNPSVYQCDRCGKELNSSISLSSHMKQHTDEVTCEICGKKLKNIRTFEHHMALHTTTKKHICPLCSNAFRTNAQLRKHTENVHSEITVPLTMSSTCDMVEKALNSV
ncbi:zinc finger protein with KRAB and SCAN domains 7-like [Phlebotomus argentipes]|uniref:zinc finger protein with KRAB and SCAN domains 7-like n=1 Tax=Phlebotomus argentipes TaxID=94469 RepID=UPI002892F228|nr:zinc finger protein with KRAB and SCAN domains 7-like [Phlebotomus argentipes]